MHSFDDAIMAIGASAQRIRCLLHSFAHSSTLPKLHVILGAELVRAAACCGFNRLCAALLMGDLAGAVGIRLVASKRAVCRVELAQSGTRSINCAINSHCDNVKELQNLFE